MGRVPTHRAELSGTVPGLPWAEEGGFSRAGRGCRQSLLPRDSARHRGHRGQRPAGLTLAPPTLSAARSCSGPRPRSRGAGHCWAGLRPQGRGLAASSPAVPSAAPSSALSTQSPPPPASFPHRLSAHGPPRLHPDTGVKPRCQPGPLSLSHTLHVSASQDPHGPGRGCSQRECRPVHQRVGGSVPSWGPCGRRLIGISVSRECFSPFLSLKTRERERDTQDLARRLPRLATVTLSRRTAQLPLPALQRTPHRKGPLHSTPPGPWALSPARGDLQGCLCPGGFAE